MTSRPNIIQVISHDTGRNIGGYGLGARTPHLDRLAADGVRLLNNFCTAPQCSPSRAGLLSGQYPHTNGMMGLAHRGFRLHPDCPRLPRLLGEAGYETHLFGSHHEGPWDDRGDLGYQERTRPDHALDVVEPLLAFLRQPRERPFYINIGLQEVHRPFNGSGDTPLELVTVPAHLPDVPDVRRDLADFAADVARVDTLIGALLDGLRDTGLEQSTLLHYTTDHGFAFPGAKGTLLDPGVGTASVWRGPGGFEGGRDLAAFTSNIDVAPTLLELVGVEVPSAMQGRSLLPLVRGESDTHRDAVFTELTYHAAYDPMRAVRTASHKYIRSYEYRPYWFPPNTDDSPCKRYLSDAWQFRTMRPRELLFDLAADPHETVNVAVDPAAADVLDALRARLDGWMEETADPLLAGAVWPPPGAELTPPTNWNPDLDPDR